MQGFSQVSLLCSFLSWKSHSMLMFRLTSTRIIPKSTILMPDQMFSLPLITFLSSSTSSPTQLLSTCFHQLSSLTSLLHSYFCFPSLRPLLSGASLVQWLRVHSAMQGHRFDPWSQRIPHATAEQLSLSTITIEPVL